MRYVLAIAAALTCATGSADETRVEASASICRARVIIRINKGRIADARLAAKVGGVLDARAVSVASTFIVNAQKQERRARSELKHAKSKPYSCNAPELAEVDTCATEEDFCAPDEARQ